jgi:hypothetical protein
MRAFEPSGLPLQIEKGPHERFLGALLQALQLILVKLAARVNASYPKDGSEGLTAYTVATRPAATVAPGAIIYVSDAAAGAKFQGSDGTNWVNLG